MSLSPWLGNGGAGCAFGGMLACGVGMALAPGAQTLGGTRMFVACSSLCFGSMTLDNALRRMRELHFAKVDLAIHAVGPHLTPAEVCGDLQRVMQKLKASTVNFAAFHVETEPFDGPEVREQLKAISRLARLLAVPIITIPAAKVESDLNEEIARLTDWNKMVMADGLILTVETKQGTHAGTVEGCLNLCKTVPGLALAYDPSHFMALPETATDPLYPHIRHVRLRDSGKKPHEFQMRVGQGEIEYSRIYGLLERNKYERALTVDVRDVADSAFPVEPEVRKLKFLLESMQ